MHNANLYIELLIFYRTEKKYKKPEIIMLYAYIIHIFIVLETY